VSKGETTSTTDSIGRLAVLIMVVLPAIALLPLIAVFALGFSVDVWKDPGYWLGILWPAIVIPAVVGISIYKKWPGLLILVLGMLGTYVAHDIWPTPLVLILGTLTTVMLFVRWRRQS